MTMHDLKRGKFRHALVALAV
ncbi:MAG: hypothetical protein QOF91_1085, partial [Alphaproteobacteria bacterium]|nr:hypothetical protein [Alphaproteobacteria bacterium]